MAFGFGGAKKMLYDNRQRPQAVYLNGTVYIGFKGDGVAGKKLPRTLTQLISYDTKSREFSKPEGHGRSITFKAPRPGRGHQARQGDRHRALDKSSSLHRIIFLFTTCLKIINLMYFYFTSASR